MKVQLISITKPYPMGDKTLSPEELIVYIARVSNPSNQLNTATADKLLNYLINNKHWSPFEMVDMTVEVKTSRAIAQQILRHWSFSFQEFSQRYAEVTEIEDIELRKKHDNNRQSSTDEFDPQIEIDCGNDITEDKASLAISDHIEYSKNLYKALLKADVAPECARFVLPLATQTTLYMKASIRDWIHYLMQRCDEHTQLEHRRIAFRVRDYFKTIFPNIAKAMLWEKL